MTISELKNYDKDILTPNDVASILGCDPNVIRRQAKEDVKALGFPCAKVGTRIKIPKQAFIDWYEGRLVGSTVGSRTNFFNSVQT